MPFKRQKSPNSFGTNAINHKKAAPEADEVISYNMPAFKYYGILVYFAAYKNHIGFYATPTGHLEFEKELSVYKQGKGSVQFPLNQPFPLDLIFRIAQFKMKENFKNAASQTILIQSDFNESITQFNKILTLVYETLMLVELQMGTNLTKFAIQN